MKKIWEKVPEAGRTPAQDVYIGPFARKCQEYALKFYPDSYYILSAKYGFLHPNDIVPENYDVSFNKPKTNPISIQELIEVANKKGILDADCIVIVAGAEYSKKARLVFPQGVILEPLKGCKGIGFMMQRINKAISSGIPIGTCN